MQIYDSDRDKVMTITFLLTSSLKSHFYVFV